MSQAHGCVQVVDGVEYYSPNSTVEGTISNESLLEDFNPFRPRGDRRSEVRFQDMLRPCMWQKAFYWTAFIPVEHWYKTYRHPPFHHLAMLPVYEYYSGVEGTGYRVHSDNGFTRLEGEVYRAVVALKNKFELPCVLPFLPNTRAYLAIHTKAAQLVHTLEETREWFSVWLGALSYCIAMARTREQKTANLKFTGYPSWRKVLLDEGLTEGWIDEVVQSPIGNFAFQIPRVGCILKTDDAHPDQPALEWFVAHSIPVWFQKASAVAQDSGCVNEERLEEGSHVNLVALGCTKERKADCGVKEGLEEPTWVTFLRDREAKYQEIERTESPTARERRQNRMRQKPIRKATVFEWVQEHDDRMVWERVPITQRCKMDTLSQYRTSQTRYDAFFNEWDCCRDFQFRDPEDDSSDEDDVNSSPTPEPEDHTAGHASQPENTDDNWTNLAMPNEALPDRFMSHGTECAIYQDVEEIFGRYYGFCSPVLATSTSEDTVSDRTPLLFQRLLGCGRKEEESLHDTEYTKSEHYQAVLQFVEGYMQGTRHNEVLYDIQDASWRPIRMVPRFRALVVRTQSGDRTDSNCRDSSPDLYVFQFERSEATVPWKLATFSPITALLVCRLPSDYRETAIAFYLAQRGIPFRVLHPRLRMSKVPSTPITHELPVRRWHHKFTQQDYESYVNNRTLLLGLPHMQAVIRRGGIAWRLAIGTLGVAEVTKGPTMWGHQFAPTAEEVEDTASTLEMDLLCGAYECITGEDCVQRKGCH
jgi:hypothetical protein